MTSNPFSEMPNRELFSMDPEALPDGAIEEITARITKLTETYRESWAEYQKAKEEKPSGKGRKKKKEPADAAEEAIGILGSRIE